MPGKIIVLDSFDDLQRLKDQLFEDVSSLEGKDVKLSDAFPKEVRIRLEGEKFHASLPSSAMEGLLDLQKGIYHSYAVLKYGDRAKRLSSEERNLLEINVKVQEGSSLLSLDWATIIEGAMSRMTGEQILAGAGMILISLLISRYMGLKYNSRKEERDNEYRKLQEQERSRTLTEIQRNTIEAVRAVSEISEETQRSSYRHLASSAQSVQIGENRVSAEELIEEVKQDRAPREVPQRYTVSGEFSVHEIRFEDEDTYIYLINQETDEHLKSVRLQDAFISESDFQIIQNAVNREPLMLRIIIEKKHDKITDAAIDSILSE